MMNSTNSMNYLSTLFNGINVSKIDETNASFDEIFAEIMNSMMLEAVNHFVKFNKPHTLADDARYFYTTKEIKTFLNLMIKSHADLKILRINKVYDNNDNFLCYEVCREKVYSRIFDTPKNVYYGSEQVDINTLLPMNEAI